MTKGIIVLFTSVAILVAVLVQADETFRIRSKQKLSLIPVLCCDVPELGYEKILSECGTLQIRSQCVNIECIFEKSGWLTPEKTLNKESFKEYLHDWQKNNTGWDGVIEAVIRDCVDSETAKYLDKPCKAYDINMCTYLAFVKFCPESAWKCTTK